MPSAQPSNQPLSAPSAFPTSAPSHDIYFDLAPDVKNITVVVTTSPLVARVDLLLSEPAIVHCGVFPAIGASNVTVAGILFQSRSSATFTTSSSVTMYNLRERTDYLVYCMTTTVDGEHNMALANILQTETAVHVPCVSSCEPSVTVLVRSKNVLMSDYFQNVLSVEFEGSDLVDEDVVAHIEVAALDSDDGDDASCSISNGVVVSPQSIWYTGGVSTAAAPVDVYVGGLCAGQYEVTVAMYAAEEYGRLNASITLQNLSSFTGVDTVYANGREFEVFSSSSGFVLPAAVTAEFKGADSEVEVYFDSLTDCAGLKGVVFWCDVLLSFPGASSSRCFWRDSSRLIITLNSGSTLLPGHNVTVLSGMIGSSAENVTSQDASESSRQSTRTLLSSSHTDVPVTAGDDVYPEIKLEAPAEQSACASFTLDLTHSTGFVGREWATASVSVRSGSVIDALLTPVDENETALVLLNEFFSNEYDIQVATVLPAGYLEAGHMYVFDIHVCNCLGKCATASHRLWVPPAYFPYSAMHKAAVSKLTVARGDVVSIPTSVVRLPCASESSTSTVSVSQVWTIVASSAVVSAADPEPLLEILSDVLQPLTLPAYSFPRVTLYEIFEVVEVTVVDNLTNARSNVTFKNLVVVQVSKSPVEAVLSGGERHILLGSGETKWIDASGSHDSDLLPSAPGAQSEGLHFVWECLRMGPLTVDTPGTDCAGFLQVNSSVRSQAAVSPAFVLSEGDAQVGSEYRLTLLVYSADMSEVDSVVLTASIISLCCVSIELAPVELYNVNDELRVSASVQSSVQGFFKWTVSEIAEAVVSDVALTATDVVFEGESLTGDVLRTISLMLPPQLLEAGFSYTVQLSFFPLLDGQDVDDVASSTSDVYTSIDVVPNSPPLPGVFTVTPGEGLSLLDDFTFQAKLWSSDHLPLLYSFGFLSVSSGLWVPLTLPGNRLQLTTLLPLGNQQQGFILSCVLHVHDVFDAQSEEMRAVKVSRSVVSRVDLSVALDDLIENDSFEFESTFGPLLESVTEVNCTLARDCSSLFNRQNCSSVAHTCGPCLSVEDFFGEDGHHNSRCTRRSTVQDDASGTCTDDSTCPVFQSCEGGECSRVSKQCSNDCSGHGECRHVVSSTGAGLVFGECVVGDTT